MVKVHLIILTVQLVDFAHKIALRAIRL